MTLLVHLILDGFAKIGLLAWAKSVTFWIWRRQNSPEKDCEEDQGSNILKNLPNIFDRHFCRVLNHLCICGNVNSVQNCYGKKCLEMIVLGTCRAKYNIGPNNSMNLGKDLLAWLYRGQETRLYTFLSDSHLVTGCGILATYTQLIEKSYYTILIKIYAIYFWWSLWRCNVLSVFHRNHFLFTNVLIVFLESETFSYLCTKM